MFDIICNRIDELLKTQKEVSVAIDGRSGAGKSRLAFMLGEKYDCNIFHMDDFFLRPEQRTAQRLEEPGGNVDYERFFSEVILGIRSGKPFIYHKFNCSKQALDETVHVEPKRLNIIEGVCCLHPHLIENYDLKIFLDLDYETQLERIRKRSGEDKLEKFINIWIPLEEKYFNELKIREKCQLVFSTSALG